MKQHFYLKERLRDKLWSFRPGCLAERLSKHMKWACHSKGQLAICVANNRIRAFKKELELWKNCHHHHELDSFPKFKGLSDEVGVILTNVISWIRKFVNLWEMCKTQQNGISRWSTWDVMKSYPGKDLSKAGLKTRREKKHCWDGSQSTWQLALEKPPLVDFQFRMNHL